MAAGIERARALVQEVVIRQAWADHQIFVTVIRRDFIHVMDLHAERQASSQDPFRNSHVFAHKPAVNFQTLIGFSSHGTRSLRRS